MVELRELRNANRADKVGGLFDLYGDRVIVQRGLVEVRVGRDDGCEEGGLEEVVGVLTAFPVLVGDKVCRVHAVAEELECHCWLEREVLPRSQVLAWRDDWRLSAKAHEAGVSTLEYTSVVVLLEVDPLDLGNVALHVDYLLSAVHLVADFVERLIHIVREKTALIHTTADRSILCDLVPEDVSLVLAIEAKIVLTLGGPEVA